MLFLSPQQLLHQKQTTLKLIVICTESYQTKVSGNRIAFLCYTLISMSYVFLLLKNLAGCSANNATLLLVKSSDFQHRNKYAKFY